MAETVGSLVDKISIVELKIYHMQEQIGRRDVSEPFREQCRQRLSVLTTQRTDLSAELTALIHALATGEVVPKVYRQFKMYNDPSYRAGG